MAIGERKMGVLGPYVLRVQRLLERPLRGNGVAFPQNCPE